MTRDRRFPASLAALPAALLLAALLPAQTLRIGTWNLEMLGCRTPPRSEADEQAVADEIRALGVAVLAVQEVCSEAALAALCRRIGPGFEPVLGTSGSWSDGRTRQSVGFVYDATKVELLHAEELLELPRELQGKPIFHRVPVTACFRTRDGKLDFRAVTVHFKAGQKPDDFAKRRLEAGQLHDWLVHVLARPDEDQDVVVLGDFNHGPGSDAQRVFEQGGAVHYLFSGKAVDPTITHFDTPIDVIAPARGFAEVRASTLDVHNEEGLADKERWQRVYSDHFPVTIEIDAREDGDPAATFWRGPAAQTLPVTLRPAGPAPERAAAGPTTKPRAEEPLPPGTRVLVRCREGLSITGALLRPLGDWVYVRDDQGLVQAFPASNVIAVQQAPR